MGILESIWFITIVLLVGIILSTDPKSANNGSGGNQLSLIFTSTSDGQKALRSFTWVLVSIFLTLSVLLSYYA
jgi:protein translocase SecG subunit